jgi:hypothetical protein
VVVIGKNKRARIGGPIKHATSSCYNGPARSNSKSLKPWPMSEDGALFQCPKLISAPNRTNKVDTVI